MHKRMLADCEFVCKSFTWFKAAGTFWKEQQLSPSDLKCVLLCLVHLWCWTGWPPVVSLSLSAAVCIYSVLYPALE